MKFHSYLIALILIGLGSGAIAKGAVVLNKMDFVHAQESARNGESIVQLDLSDSGLAKVKELNQYALNKKVSFFLGGKTYAWILRDKISANKIEAGPVSHDEAEKIVQEVNTK